MDARRLLAAAAAGLTAGLAVLLITSAPGPGLDPDPVSYLGAAESLRRDGTLEVPYTDWVDPDSTSTLSHFPPGFSVTIAGFEAVGLPRYQAARAVIVVSAAVTAGLIAWWLAAEAGIAAGALALALALASPQLATDYVRILSEPLFIALMVLQLVLMVRRPRAPLFWGLVAAASVMVRYLGLALVGAAVLVAWWRGQARRLRDAALAAAPGFVVYGAWTLYLHSLNADERAYGWYPGLWHELGEGLKVVLAWLAPGIAGTVPRWLVAAVACAGAASVVAGARRQVRWLAIAGVLVLAQAAMLVVSRAFADPGVPFDERMLSPIILVVLAAFATSFVVLWRTWSRGVRVVAAVLLVAWGAASAVATSRFIREARLEGWGYASPVWRESAAGRWLRGEGRRHAIFTDNPAAVWYVTHRPMRGLPGSLAPDSLRAFADTLRARDGVIMDWAHGYDTEVDPAALARALGLHELAGDSLGRVWGR